MYSEKATKILRNLPLTFDYSTYGQKLGKISQNFVAFSEYMNFNFVLKIRFNFQIVESKVQSKK